MQVMLNLVSNAVKFTPQNGKIDISVQMLGTDESLEISVRDNGTGIKAED
jgi:signal transduction histidine kinase